MLGIARDFHQGVNFDQISGVGVPYADSSLELVYSVTVVHHNPHGQQEGIPLEMVRVLRKGGILILFDDTRPSEQKSFNMFPRSQPEWIALVESQGPICTWSFGAKYWPLRNSAPAMMRRLMPIRNQRMPSSPLWKSRIGSIGSLSRGVLGWLDLATNPYLLPFIPERYHESAIMVFRKQ
jgi:SAM-dependent methyltransferase